MNKEKLENKIITEIDNKIKDEKELLVVLSEDAFATLDMPRKFWGIDVFVKDKLADTDAMVVYKEDFMRHRDQRQNKAKQLRKRFKRG